MPRPRTRMPQDAISDARGVLDHAITEKAFQALVIDTARMFGWFGFHAYDARRSAAGYPDLTLIHREHGVIWVELKTMRGRLSRDQQLWLRALMDAGQRAYVWRPCDFPEIEAVLRGEEAER